MAKLRPAKCHRRLKRAFTRTSKYRKKSYIRAAPNHKIIHFDSGNKRYEFFPSTVTLYAKKDINLRHNAIEAGRIAINRYMNKVLGKAGFGFKVRVFPHQIIRENPIAMGAGADRMSQGMRAAFGKSISRSARVKKGQAIMQLFIPTENIADAKVAFKKGASKFPIACKAIAEDNKIFDPNLKKEDLNLSRVITEEPEEVVQTETEPAAVAASE